MPSSLPFAPPKQSYIRFGPVTFDEGDISKDRGLIVIEHDLKHCRVDQMKSCNELQERVS